ncbi:hypothetical protein FSP39_016088 [Pinctada imbricata]|uniref:Uncharacterized protein n=1 Tax=Pinctada imbricata TaxID=66713 RepID=A0AA89BXK0_PINIB|nr:hypothetical protein FSP39_016088 [Pinctada imbricata]
MKISFLKISDISTISESFTADVFLQARWREPALDHSRNVNTEINWNSYWNPKIVIPNILSERKHLVWNMLQTDENGQTYVLEKHRIKAVFAENQELLQFPFDIQDLSILVSSSLSVEEVSLLEDDREVSNVHTETFTKQQEWSLYDCVTFTSTELTKEYANTMFKNPGMYINCMAKRRGGFFIWNVMLIMDDGYFYLGTVKSQVLSDKFLIAFGPCKHGKYKETSYQDTLIFDIIDYADAQRHSILSGDKVLAPWEPEGERYGPGVVIEGHEKRQASGPDDSQITVTFTNGRTEKVPVDKAVWTPDPVYERLSLELKMPKEARMAMQTTDHYPKENLPGYPTSGPEAVPDDFSPPQPFGWDYEPVFMEGRPWMYPYVASAPMLYKKEDVTSTITRSTVKSEDVNKLIPGTNLTEKELHEKISSQLAEHKLELDERQTEKSGKMEAEVLRRQMEERRKLEEEERLRYEQMREQAARKEELERREAAEREAELLRQRKIQLEKDIEEEKILLLEKEKERHRLRLEEIERELHRRDRVIYEDKRISQSEDARNIQSDSRLLLKREQQEENLLKKSGVTFQDEVEAEEKKLERSDMIDSGVHISDDEEKYREEFNFDKFSPDQDQRPTMHIDHCGDPRLRYRRIKRQTKDQTRPPWRKYWTTDNIPDIIQPPSHGPYRETANQAPLEARDMKRYPYACEWTSPVYNYVDPFAKHNYNSSVEMLLKTPQPPPTQKQQYIDVRGTRPSSAMTKEEARREYRRQRVAARTREWNERLCKEDMMKELMQDHHRERVLAQLQRDQDRLMKEQETIMQTRAAKRQIASDLKAKREEAKLKKEEKDRRRIEAMRQRREVREEAMAQKQKEEECIAERRQEAKEKRSQQRWDSVHQRLEQEEKENQQQAEKVLNAKLRRAEHFQKLEQQGQANKDLRIKVTDQHLAMYRSQVLP